MSAANRNKPCTCGSGRKQKNCCFNGAVIHATARAVEAEALRLWQESVKDCKLPCCRCKTNPYATKHEAHGQRRQVRAASVALMAIAMGRPYGI